MCETRRPERGGAVGREHDRGRARAAASFESGAEPGPQRVGDDDERDRAEPAAIASAPAFSASMPAWAEPDRSAPPTLGAEPERGGEEGEARALGERRAAGAPEDGVDGVGVDPGCREGGGGRVPGQGEGVFVGCAGRDLTPAGATPRRPDVGGRHP